MKLTKEWKQSLTMLAIGAVILAIFIVPGKIEDARNNAFAAPLFDHALPAGAKLVSANAVTDDDGGMTASLILEGELTEEDLLAHYGDTDYPPPKEGRTVELSAAPLDSTSILALEKAGLLNEGSAYWFVYIYSP